VLNGADASALRGDDSTLKSACDIQFRHLQGTNNAGGSGGDGSGSGMYIS